MTDTEHMREDVSVALVERMDVVPNDINGFDVYEKTACGREHVAWFVREADARRAAAPPAQEDVERVARVLYECEKRRAEQARDVLRLASGKPCSGILMEPYEECAEVFRSDARAALAAMPSPVDAERRGMMRAVEIARRCQKTWLAESKRTSSNNRSAMARAAGGIIKAILAAPPVSTALSGAPAPDASGWQLMETAPVGEEFIAYHPMYAEYKPRRIIVYRHTTGGPLVGWPLTVPPTHWCPLPPFPEATR